MLKEKLFDIFKELEDVFEDEKEQNRLIPYLVYVFEISEIDTDDIRNILTEISRDGGNKVVSTAMKLREEGREEERAKFEKERYEFKKERTKTVKKMLADGMDVRIISKYTGLSKEEIEKFK